MSDIQRLQLARRMSAQLQRELGEGIDVQRMVAQPLYARDVLLVCQAMPETELPGLAHEFVAAAVRPRGVGAPPLTALTPTTSHSDSAGEPSVAPDSTSGDSRAGSDSTPSGWVASLWPATMRGSLFGGRGKKRDTPKPR